MEPRPEADIVCTGAALTSALIAPASETRPRPCVLADTPEIGDAVERSACLTWSGVHSGCALRISAARPDTTAADSEVPEPLMYVGLTSAFGFSFSTVEPSERVVMSERPGATTSGLVRPCAVGPREDQPGMESSEV